MPEHRKTGLWLLLAVCAIGIYFRVVSTPARLEMGGDRFRVTRSGQLLLESEPHPLGWRRLPNQDLTGDGRPECICWGDLGGTYPYVNCYVFDLQAQDPLLLHQTLPRPALPDLDGDGRCEFLVSDTKVGPFKEYPFYVCRLQDRQLRVAPDLMRLLPQPDPVRMQEAILANRQLQAQHLASFYDSRPASEVRKMANELVYCGRADQALDLINQAWPEPVARRHFLIEYTGELRQSPILSALKELNGSKLAWLDNSPKSGGV